MLKMLNLLQDIRGESGNKLQRSIRSKRNVLMLAIIKNAINDKNTENFLI